MLYLFKVLLLVITLRGFAYADVALCVRNSIVNLVTNSITASGFHLWNDRGEQASHYRTTTVAYKVKLENNGWAVNLDCGDTDAGCAIPRAIVVKSDKYGWSDAFTRADKNLNSFVSKGRGMAAEGSKFFKCFDKIRSGWCEDNYGSLLAACENISIGVSAIYNCQMK